MSDAPQDKRKTDDTVRLVETPPTSIGGIIRRLGPGLIVAGSIVGSGELIATTKTGAEAGFWLLWLIIIGCVIKVFVQVEFGRYSIVNGRTTMSGLNSVPGPTLEFSITNHPDSKRLKGNWIVWYWFLMWLASIGQLGGIVGGVGQALAISWPLTEQGRRFNDFVDHRTELTVKAAEQQRLLDMQAATGQVDAVRLAALQKEIAEINQWLAAAEIELTNELGADVFRSNGGKPMASYDDRIWATVIAVITSIVLVAGRYGLIQNFSTVMVCGFTLITVLNLVMLQANPSWAVSASELVQGLSFRLPPPFSEEVKPLATALATFGIIGVGASELVTYPYWCIEKGYARFTGPRDSSDSWADRARGWMRVLRWDAWCSMVVYTFATIAFYLLGAAILGRTRLNPEGNEMIRTLAVMYEPVFGESARVLFLFGAFAVLYSTYFVANASHARVFSDALRVLGAAASDEAANRRRVTFLSAFFPLLCLVMYLTFPKPARLVLISGLMQAIMLPMLAVAGLYFRYRQNDRRLMPGGAWDVFLWVSAAGMAVAGIWSLVSKLT